MELVYLWVEDYKNIHQQGFNFSPRFECTFHDEYEKDADGKDKLKDGCKLEIKPKEHIENFFGKNINVTAIVGENGSGKSTVSTNIQILFFKAMFENAISSIGSFMLYLNSNKKFILLNNPKISSNIKMEHLSESQLSNIKFPSFDYSATVNPFLFNIQKNQNNKIVKEYFPQYPDKFNGTNIGIDIEEQRNINQSLVLENYFKNENYLEACKNFFVPYQIKSDKENIEISELKKKLNGSIDKLKNYLKDNNISVLDKNGKDVNILSFGELQLLNLLNGVFNLAHKNDYEESFVIFFDEIDLGLHPNWQKKILTYILDYLKLCPHKKFHLIFTSHSPFILSDIPKENVIFLEKGKQVDVNIETFGANIHTLLSHGFFMKDGLMGEFAKGKIDEAIKLLNQKSLNEDEIGYCENIISIIGEPILKRQLQKMLDSKRLSEVEQIKQEIKRLEERMTLIWKNSK